MNYTFHTQLPSLSSSGAVSGLLSQDGEGAVWDRVGVGWTVIVSAGSDAIGLPRLDLPLPLLPPSPPALSIHLTPSPGSIRIN